MAVVVAFVADEMATGSTFCICLLYLCLIHLFYFTSILICFHSSFICIFYFIFSSELLSRTSSQTGGRWYLPTVLFRDGLLTLMYIDSFMNLMRFWSSPTILRLSNVVLWPVMLKWSNIGDGSFRCSLNSLQMFLKTLLCMLIHIPPFHTCIYI